MALDVAPQPRLFLDVAGGSQRRHQAAELGAVVAVVVVGVGVGGGVVQRFDVVDDGEVEVAFERPGQPLRPFDVFDLRVDADLGQLRRDDLAALARIRRRRQGQRQVQRRRDAGFFQQCFGFFHVVGVGLGQIQIAEVGGREVAADGLAQAFLRAVDEGLAVDGMADCAAHPHIVQRRLPVVDGNDALARCAAQFHREARIALKLFDRLQRAEARHAVDVTCQQGRHLRGRVVDETEGHAFDLQLGRVAVVGGCHQCDRRTLGPVVQLVGPRAHRLGGGAGGRVRVQDDGGVFAQAEGHQRVGVVQHEDDGVRVLHHHAADVVEHRLLRLVGAALGAGAVKAELDGICIKGRTVRELDALLQREGVGLAVGGVEPVVGQQRRDSAVHRDLGQPFKDVEVNDFANGRSRCRRGVQAWCGLQDHAQHEAVSLRLCLGIR